MRIRHNGSRLPRLPPGCRQGLDRPQLYSLYSRVARNYHVSGTTTVPRVRKLLSEVHPTLLKGSKPNDQPASQDGKGQEDRTVYLPGPSAGRIQVA
jgi:hypothetical protein